MKKLIYLIVLALILGLVLTGCLLSNVGQVPTSEQSGITYLTKNLNGELYTEENPFKTDLKAGQNTVVGEVQVWNDAENLHITYVIDEPGWYLTETHLHVACSEEDIPQTKKGNPKPGHFDYSSEHEIVDCVTEYPLKPILLSSIDCCEPFIAAHAVVVKQLTDGGCAAYVHESSQGTERDGSSIQTDRREPANALGSINNSFFSLGFVDETSGGNIVLEFENYVGTSLNVVEQSPGTIWRGTGYPLEQAEVWVSANLVDWTYLGMANNQIAGGPDPGQSHENVFDLEECIKFVKIVDQTEPTPQLGDTADAFDIDAVCGGPCYQEETAWVDGDRFVEKGNWAMYFTYLLQPVRICADFSGLAEGASVEGLGTVDLYLNIHTPDGNAVKIVADPVTNTYGAFGAGNTACGDASTLNGGIADGGGFSNVVALQGQDAHSYTFEFSVPISEFSLHMLDYGDWNPSRASLHLAMMKAYNNGGGEVDEAVISYTSDGLGNPRVSGYGDLLCNNGDALTEPGGPGNWTWVVLGVGITKVELTFPTGYDPGIGFDNLCFTIYECVEVD